MTRRELKHVMKICPNVKFSLECQRADFVSCFKMMGKRLDKVGFGIWPECNDVSYDQAGAWVGCPNLREIVMDRELQLCEFRAIFNTPKVLLKDVYLSIVDCKALDVFSGGAATSPESVVLWCSYPLENPFKRWFRRTNLSALCKSSSIHRKMYPLIS